MKKLNLLLFASLAVMVTGCTFGSQDCLKVVAAAELAVRQTAQTVTAMNEKRDITIETAKTASSNLKRAEGLLEDAPRRCITDPESAFSQATAAEELVQRVTQNLKDSI